MSEQLLKEILNEMKSMKSEISTIQQNMATKDELTKTNQELAKTNQELAKVSQTVTRIENIHGDKLSALFDAREVQLDANKQIIQQLDRIENKIETHDIKIAVLDRRRRAK